MLDDVLEIEGLSSATLSLQWYPGGNSHGGNYHACGVSHWGIPTVGNTRWKIFFHWLFPPWEFPLTCFPLPIFQMKELDYMWMDGYGSVRHAAAICWSFLNPRLAANRYFFFGGGDGWGYCSNWFETTYIKQPPVVGGVGLAEWAMVWCTPCLVTLVLYLCTPWHMARNSLYILSHVCRFWLTAWMHGVRGLTYLHACMSVYIYIYICMYRCMCLSLFLSLRNIMSMIDKCTNAQCSVLKLSNLHTGHGVVGSQYIFVHTYACIPGGRYIYICRHVHEYWYVYIWLLEFAWYC